MAYFDTCPQDSGTVVMPILTAGVVFVLADGRGLVV